MKGILAQTSKEWSEFRRDRLSVVMAFVLPLASLFLLGYGIRLESRNIPLIVEDQDKSFASRTFIDRLYATNTLVRGSWKNHDTAEAAMVAGGAKVAIIVPPDFSKSLGLGHPASVQALLDGSDVITAHVASSIIHGSNTFFARTMQTRSDNKPYFVLPRLRIWFNPGCKESLFIVPGAFAVVLWLYPSLLAAVAAAREKDQGTIIQVYAAGMRASEYIVGKGLLYMIIGLCEALLIVGAANLLFGLSFVTDPTAFLITTPVYVANAVMFGLFLGTRASSQVIAVQAASTAGFFPSLLLSGFVYPINNIPFPLSVFSYIVPARYYIEVTRDAFVRGAGWTAIWFDPLIILGFFAGLFGVTWLSIRRMQMK